MEIPATPKRFVGRDISNTPDTRDKHVSSSCPTAFYSPAIGVIQALPTFSLDTPTNPERSPFIARRTVSSADRTIHDANSLVTLPDDIIYELCELLDPEDLINLRKTCKLLNTFSRERIVWVRTMKRRMQSYSVRDRTYVRPESLSAATAEMLATRPLRLSKLLDASDPSTTSPRSSLLRFPDGFTPAAISDVVHGRWLAVAGNNTQAGREDSGRVFLFDLGFGHAAGTGLPFAKLSLPFVGDGALVDLAPLPNSTLLLLAFTYNPPVLPPAPPESMLQVHVINVDIQSFGLVPSFDLVMSTPLALDMSLCRDTIALDLENGVICLVNWLNRSVGMMTCNQMMNSTLNMAIQLIPGAVLVADPYNAAVYSLPLIPLASGTAINHVPILQVRARDVASLPVDTVRRSYVPLFGEEPRITTPARVRFLRPPVDHAREGYATLHVVQEKGHIMHFGTAMQVFRDVSSVSIETLPSMPPYTVVGMAQVRDKLVVFTEAKFGMNVPVGVVTLKKPPVSRFRNFGGLRPLDAPFTTDPRIREETKTVFMDGIEFNGNVHRPFLTRTDISDQGWQIASHSVSNDGLNRGGMLFGGGIFGGMLAGLFAGVGPVLNDYVKLTKTKRTGAVVDEIGGRVVLLEVTADSRPLYRVRILEYD